IDVTFTDLEKSPQVLLVGFEPEEEAGNVFLRLRKGVIKAGIQVATIAPFATRGTTKMRATLLPTTPGEEAAILTSLKDGGQGETQQGIAQRLREEGAIIVVGERLSQSPGGLTAALALAEETGARLTWIPRRAGDRGAVEAGLLPNLLPGGRPVEDADARVDAGAVWGVSNLPTQQGRDLGEILEAATQGDLTALIVGGVDLNDLPDAEVATEAISNAFTVQLEVRRSEITEHADIVLPVAPPIQKSGTFLNWEGRPRSFEQVFESSTRSDAGVLDMLGAAMGTELNIANLDEIHQQLGEFANWDGAKAPAPNTESAQPVEGEYILATWRMMLDSARGQDGEPHLAGTAHRP
ncbi:MAG TPA: molybdopterin-dependent oxidoreductase, partial [Beutenbergiaceae bacterium]|nr:molybdopterin-dependent oxidoreductase [Beutenbergiaceae bacterium]